MSIFFDVFFVKNFWCHQFVPGFKKIGKMQKEAIALAAQIAYKNNANVSLSLNLKQIAIIIL